MPTRPINRNRPKDESTFDLQALAGRVASWLSTKRQVAKLSRQLDSEKTDFKGIVHARGVADDKGSLFVELAAPVLGVKALKNQRSVVTGWNEESAKKICEKAGILDTVYPEVTTRVWDPDKIYAAFYDKKITKAQLDKIFPEEERFSFYLLDENGRAVT